MMPAANGGNTTAAAGGDTWTPMSNLDASGALIAPADGTGFQISSTQFDLEPGQELFNCFHVSTPNDKVFPVGMWEAQMSAGSHHFILYRSPQDAQASETGSLTQGGCTQGFGGNSWLYTQGSPRSHLQFPEGVAMELQPHEKIDFDMHYINTGTDVIHAKITLNVNQVKSEKYQKADAQISFNTGIAIPPHGEQTVQGDCQPVMGANYFLVQTHTHKHATMATVSRTLANGMPGETFVTTTNWDTPDVKVWQQAPFLTFQPGEKMHYSCSYKNDSANLVTVGTSADTNEMCMAEAYFYPASGSTPVCN
jgi:hypothetical protein